jgi:hypothetical protein
VAASYTPRHGTDHEWLNRGFPMSHSHVRKGEKKKGDSLVKEDFFIPH